MLIHCGSEAHRCAPFPGLRGCCQNLLMCMWQTWEHIKALALFFLFWLSALWESKLRHKALSVRAVCLDLTLVCLHACVCARVHVCARICVAHHIKERWSGSVVMTSDPGMLRDRGRVEEEEGKKKTQSNMLTHTYTQGKRVGSAQSLNAQQLEKQPQTET